jgi:hypothetical protein
MGKVRPTVALTSSDIEDGAITTDKIVDDAVTDAKVANAINTEIAANTAKTGITSGQASAITANTAKVTNATHTGDVTGATALTIAAGAVDIAMLSATGTASSSTFLRGDNAWAAAGGFTPAFMVWRSTDQSIVTTTWTKVQYNTEIFDSNGAYDNSTNYRFTVPVGEAGKYVIHWSNRLESGTVGTALLTNLYINGSPNTMGFHANGNRGWAGDMWANNTAVIDLAASDYVESFAYHPTGDTRTLNLSFFWGFKLVGV